MVPHGFPVGNTFSADFQQSFTIMFNQPPVGLTAIIDRKRCNHEIANIAQTVADPAQLPVEPYAMAIGIDVSIAHVGVAVHQTKGTGLRALPFVQLGVNPIKARMIFDQPIRQNRSEEHTSELQSLMRISYAVICLKKKKHKHSHDDAIIYTHDQTSRHTPHTL